MNLPENNTNAIEQQELPKVNIVYACILQGRGHLTQVKAFDNIIKQTYGDNTTVKGIILTGEPDRSKIPDLKELGISPENILLLPTFRFETDADTGAINSTKSVLNSIKSVPPMIWHSATTLRHWLHERFPADDNSVNVIADFYGGIVGFSSTIGTLPEGIVHLPFATQFQLAQEGYYFPHRLSFDGRKGLALLNKTNSGHSTKYAISVKPYEDIYEPNADGSLNLPPLIPTSFINSIENLPEKKDKILMYLLNPGFIDEIVNWSNQNPQQELIVYTDIPAEIKLANGEIRMKSNTFNQEMLEASVLISSGGVQTPIEAILANCVLGIFPTPNHSEQLSNTVNAARNWKLANMVSADPIRLLNWGQKMLIRNDKSGINRYQELTQSDAYQQKRFEMLESGTNRYQELTQSDAYQQKRFEMLEWVKSAQTAYPEIFKEEVLKHVKNK